MEKRYRIQKNKDFTRAYKKAMRFYNKDISILVNPNGLKNKRFGYTLSRKFGKANKRNKVRRRLKEIIRLNMDEFNDGHDYIIMPRSHCIELSYKELEKSLFHCYSIAKKRMKW